jgi:presenilin-like A22 family membrane protease
MQKNIIQMKHNVKITLILLGMFLITQFISLAVVSAYSAKTTQQEINGTIQNVTIKPTLPYGMEPPAIKPADAFTSIIISLIIVFILFFFLTRIKAKVVMIAWFSFVVLLTLGITINSVLKNYLSYSHFIALVIALPLMFYKVFQRNMIVHNLTELLIYPGIAAVFVPILNIWTAIAILVLIAGWDVYAVFKSKVMQKMAKYQIEHVGIFAGFFIPYMTKKDRNNLKKIKEGFKDKEVKNMTKSMQEKFSKQLKKKQVKISLAILGGGDVAFPAIFAGVVLVSKGLIPALLVIGFALISLSLLLFLAKRDRFYPAMLFLTPGCILGYLAGLLI